MAIHEQKRENLIQEATAYSRRMQINLESVEFQGKKIGQLFAGMRRDGRWSLYFDESPVLQFDQSGRLRRLVILPRKFKAQQGSLVELKRATRGGHVVLETQPTSSEQCRLMLQQLSQLIERTLTDLLVTMDSTERSKDIQQVPPDDHGLIGELARFLSQLSSEVQVSEIQLTSD